MTNFLPGVLLALIVTILGGLAYIRLGFVEVTADIPAARWERALMFGSVHASVRCRAPETANPVLPTDENLVAGGKIYLDGCAG